jgi:hypothetical protein
MKLNECPVAVARNAAPWRGEPVNGKTILIRAGGAPSETLFGFRYVAQLAAQGADVVIQVEAGQRALLGRMGGVRLALDIDAPAPPVDYATSFDALDLLLEPRVDARTPAKFEASSTSRSFDKSYLRADRARVGEWRTGLRNAASNAERHLLLAFGERGSSQPHQTIPVSALAPLWALTHLHFAVPATCIEPWERHALADTLNLSIVEAADLDHQAALASAVDEVIAVDSRMAHIAGAVGAKGHVLLSATPDWRWLRSRSGLNYYPTLTPIRQTRVGDWRSVIERLARTLEQRSTVTA